LNRVRTKVTSAKDNGGLHSPREFKKAKAMLEDCSYKKPRLYHLCLMDSTQVKTYQDIIKALVAELRRNKIPCQWKAALEEDDSKYLHMHIYLLVEAIDNNPDHILNRKDYGWLHTLAAKNDISFKLNHPRDPIHFKEDGNHKNYATLPKSKPEKLADCIEWISYLYKMRSKPDRRQIYFSSRPSRAAT
jgi:hypothetical protein